MKRLINCFILFLCCSNQIFGQFVLEKTIVPRDIPQVAAFNAIAVSQFGDIYLLESKGHEIYHLDNQGKVLARNGGYGWGEGQFDTPLDISLFSGLDLIVADYNNHRIVRFDRKLNYITSYPDPNSRYELSFPRSVILTGYGEIFILEDEDDEIVRLNVSRQDITVFGGLEYDKYALYAPLTIRMTDKGQISVLEESGRILLFDRYGTPSGQLQMNVKSRILGMTPVGADFCVMLDAKPWLYYYSAVEKSWESATISGVNMQDGFVAASYRNEKLYLLRQSGKITICSPIRADIKK
jgi:hypothetical protein